MFFALADNWCNLRTTTLDNGAMSSSNSENNKALLPDLLRPSKSCRALAASSAILYSTTRLRAQAGVERCCITSARASSRVMPRRSAWHETQVYSHLYSSGASCIVSWTWIQILTEIMSFHRPSSPHFLHVPIAPFPAFGTGTLMLCMSPWWGINCGRGGGGGGPNHIAPL